MSSSLVTVKLSRFDGSSWGFRLQGGKDFGQPLVIQKVSVGSLAEKAGLMAGDAVVRVNTNDIFNLRHKEAQDAIVRAGNNFELTVQRGGGTWKPQVTPVGTLSKPNAGVPLTNIQPVTKTSLASRKPEPAPIGTGHNVAAKPFAAVPQVNGTEPTVKAIVNKQYNTPVGMYSEETIAETLSAQAEVLAGGVLGVNFKKNERNYDAAKSEVFKMIQEIDKEPREPEPGSGKENGISHCGVHIVPKPYTPPRVDSPDSGKSNHSSGSSTKTNYVQSQTFLRLQAALDEGQARTAFLGRTTLRFPTKSMTPTRTYSPTPQQQPQQTPHTQQFQQMQYQNPQQMQQHPQAQPQQQMQQYQKTEQYYETQKFEQTQQYTETKHEQTQQYQETKQYEQTQQYQETQQISDQSQSQAQQGQGAQNLQHPSTPTFRATSPIPPYIPTSPDETPAKFSTEPPQENLPAPSPAPMQTTPGPPGPEQPESQPEASNNPSDTQPNQGLNEPSTAPASYPSDGSPVEVKCSGCQEQIVGVFVRIKDKNLHVECFKCATCGTSLKNVGYYNINAKLYCDIHAKLVARQHPPAPNLEPVTVPPGGKAPAGAISAALAHSMASASGPGTPTPIATAPMSPQPGTMAPLPFHPTSKVIPMERLETVYSPEVAKLNGQNHHQEMSRTTPENYETRKIIPENGFMRDTKTIHAENNNTKEIKTDLPKNGIDHGIMTTTPVTILNETTTIVPENSRLDSTDSVLIYPDNKLATERKPFHLDNNNTIQSVVATHENNVAKETNRILPENNIGKDYNKAPRVGTSHVTAPRTIIQSPAPSAPKPFSSVSAPSPAASVTRPTSDYIVSTLRESVEKKEYPICESCGNQIPRGPFITALGKTWCPDHFVCVKEGCRRPLQDIGFVEEQGQLYCEYCFEKFLAPTCNKCNIKIKGDCLNAIGQHFHPECFSCTYCRKLFGNNPFFLEDGQPYCEADWNELFTTKCFACGFPIEAGDRWVEALNNNYHSQCFNCSMCKKNLEGQSFYAKSGRPFCKNHAR